MYTKILQNTAYIQKISNYTQKIFSRCHTCGLWGYILCTQCRKHLYPHPSICFICTSQSNHYKVCGGCTIKEQTALTHCVIGFSYCSTIKSMLYNLKYKHIYQFAPFFAQQLVYHLLDLDIHQNILSTNTIISYVPGSRLQNIYKKGYNQAHLIAKHIGYILKLPCISLGEKRLLASSQVGKTRLARQKNASNNFICNTVLPCNTTIILIDDICTSGSSLLAFAKAISTKNPHCTIIACVVARNTT